MKTKSKKVSPKRNPLALNPLMKKGGAHGKSKKAMRQARKNSLRREMKREGFAVC